MLFLCSHVIVMMTWLGLLPSSQPTPLPAPFSRAQLFLLSILFLPLLCTILPSQPALSLSCPLPLSSLCFLFLHD